MNFCNISLHKNFLAEIAQYLLKKNISDKDVIIVPGYRIQRELKRKILEYSAGDVVVLPRIFTFSDLSNNLVLMQPFLSNLDVFVPQPADKFNSDIILFNIVKNYKETDSFLWFQNIKQFINHYYSKCQKVIEEHFDEKNQDLYNILKEFEDVLAAKNSLLENRRKLLAANIIDKATLRKKTSSQLYIVPSVSVVDYIQIIINKLMPAATLFLHGFTHDHCINKRQSFYFAKEWVKEEVLPREELIEYKNIKHYVEADNRLEEAKIITLMVNNLINQGQKNIAIICNDNALSQYIKSYSAIKWNLYYDESNPPSINNYPQTTSFFILLEILYSKSIDIVKFLGLLKSASATIVSIDDIHSFEVDIVRNNQHINNLYELQKLLIGAGDNKIVSLVNKILDNKRSLRGLIDIYREYFYQGSEKEDMLLQHCKDVLNYNMPKIVKEDKDFVSYLLKAISLRNDTPADDFVKIVTSLESRYMSFDNIIIAGCNEGVFPKLAYKSGYITQKLYNDLDIDNIDEELGFSSYDFIHLLASKNVSITRSMKYNGEPVEESRWLGFIHGKIQCQSIKSYYDYIHEMESNNLLGSYTVPQQVVKQKQLKFEMSASALELLMHNPYVYYAKYILELRPIESWGRDKVSRVFGIVMHDVLAIMLQSYNDITDLNLYIKKCCELFDQYLHQQVIDVSSLKYSWEKKVASIASDLFYYEQGIRGNLSDVIVEKWCSCYLDIDNKMQVKLYAKPDRVNKLKNNKVQIIDYKTGVVPSNIDVSIGKSPQLPIELFILEGSDDDELIYIGIKGTSGNINIKNISVDYSSIEEGVNEVINLFFGTNVMFFAVDEASPKTQDYQHLLRKQEWQAS